MSLKEKLKKIYGPEPTSMDEVGNAILKIVRNYKDYKSGQNPIVLGFMWNMTWSKQVPNSHAAPEGFSTNWHREKKLPLYYSGWVGRLWIRYKNDLSFGSEALRNSLSHTGTGGSGTYNGIWGDISRNIHYWESHVFSKNLVSKQTEKYLKKHIFPSNRYYSWDYIIFDNDWPLLNSELHYNTLWMIGKMEDSEYFYNNLTHSFRWEESESLKKDNIFNNLTDKVMKEMYSIQREKSHKKMKLRLRKKIMDVLGC